jgi:hypothetical protein
MGTLIDWLQAHPAIASAITIASLLVFVGCLFAVPVFVARIPADYFARREPPAGPFRSYGLATRAGLVALKNLLGLLLVALGIVMLLTPGQGLITILLGLILLDGPGKRRFELFVVRQPAVRRSLDWLRRRRGKPPLEIWEPGGEGGARSS